MSQSERIEKVIARVEKAQVDAVLISNIKNVRYLTGFTGMNGYLILNGKKRIFITDFTHLTQAEEQVKDIPIHRQTKVISKELETLIPLLGFKSLGFEANHLVFREYEELKEKLKDVQLVPLVNLIEELRMVKDEQEIEAIHRAQCIAQKAFKETLPLVKHGLREVDLALELEYRIKMAGGESIAFETIVASGYRSALPHGSASKKIIMPGEPVLFDFGTSINGYHSDCTRMTFPSGMTEEMSSVLKIVKEAQRAAIEKLKPGMMANEVDKIARDIIKESGYGELFGHGLGHGVGIDVHEAPSLSTEGKFTIQIGNVFSIEPGIYFPGKFGIRIEDLVAVTENGARILGNDQ